MPKKKVKKMVEVEVDEDFAEEQKPVVCGHEEIVAANGDEEAVFRCGKHGEHKLSQCQELCVE